MDTTTDALPAIEPARAARFRPAHAVAALLLLVSFLVRSGAFLGFVIAAAIFVPLERMFPIRSERVLRPGWKTDAMHFLVNQVFVLLGTVITTGIAVVAIGRIVPLDGIRAAVASQPSYLQFLEAVVLIGVTGYWAHRMAHTVPWLWRFHAVHHSSPHLDWLAAARVHPVDVVLLNFFVVLPLFVLGFSRETLGLYIVWATIAPVLDHSNVRLRLPGLRWLIQNPEWHHWHHAAESQAINKNFSPFPWVDVAFGTAYMPTDRRPARYGIDEEMPEGYLDQLLKPFRAPGSYAGTQPSP